MTSTKTGTPRSQPIRYLPMIDILFSEAAWNIDALALFLRTLISASGESPIP